MKDPYIVCLVPTRGDRKRMLGRCIEMMERQTLLPREVFLMNDPPLDAEKKDITWRYRTGLERISERHPDLDLVLFIEDDDWYSSSYIEVFHRAWSDAGRPDIFGISETRYYHVGLRKHYHEVHPGRASAFSTGMTLEGARRMRWPSDEHSFVDLEMWRQLNGPTFTIDPPLCIGMKGHGEGRFFGGIGHNDEWKGYMHNDEDLSWIRSILDQDSFDFYFRKTEGPVGTLSSLGPNKKTQGEL